MMSRKWFGGMQWGYCPTCLIRNQVPRIQFDVGLALDCFMKPGPDDVERISYGTCVGAVTWGGAENCVHWVYDDYYVVSCDDMMTGPTVSARCLHAMRSDEGACTLCAVIRVPVRYALWSGTWCLYAMRCDQGACTLRAVIMWVIPIALWTQKDIFRISIILLKQIN